MEQIEMLWQYQQADMEADALENEMKRSPNRLTLVKNRDFLMEQQGVMKRMEEEIGEMLDRVDVIKDAIRIQEEQLKALQSRLADEAPTDLDAARELSQDAQRLLGDIVSYEQEMRRIQKDAADRERQEKETRVKCAKVKAEYDALRVTYEAEKKEQMKQLEEKRRAAEQKAEGIDPGLLERYRAIKLHIVPPMARLIGDQCGGCNMSLPSVVLRNIKSGNKVIECETCGRMIVQM